MNREPRTATCRYEQAVYGSFPFWDKGYALLAHSPGCRPEWLDEFRAVCQKFGERPRGATDPFPGAMMSVRLASGPWLVVGIESPGADDRGRPDALAFHGLFLSDREFRKALANPFAFEACLRGDWGLETSRLEAGSCRVSAPDETKPIDGSDAARIAALMMRGKRVAIETAEPIDALARSVWAALPAKARRSRSMATWAFANGLRLDLFATPRLAAVELDSSYVDPSAPMPSRRQPTWLVGAAGAMILAMIAGAGAWIWSRPERDADWPPDGASIATVLTPIPETRPTPNHEPTGHGPSLSSYRTVPDDPAEVVAAERGLATFGNRFLGVDADAARGPTAWMQAASALRYEGTRLSPAERDTIARGTAPGRSRALAWDDHIGLFAPDRPLPPGFASGPLRWQLDTLAWSFHLELNPTLTAAEMPAAIADALARHEPIAPNPLEAEYPALAEYAKFLGRLPMR